MNKGIEDVVTLGENKNNESLNESVLSDINSSVLSNLSEATYNRENSDINSNFNLFNSQNDLSYISRDQYACSKCEFPPEILFDSTNVENIKIKCERHGLKSFLIKDFLRIMSRNTYHFYKCGFCLQNCQKNFSGQVFKYCYQCKKIICPKCFLKHKSYKNHKRIFNSNEINIRCENHFGEKFVMYCYDCDKTICKQCSEENHRGHFFISLKELNPSQEVIEKINTNTEKLKQELNNLIKKIEYMKNVIILNELIVSTYKKYENNYHHIINVSNLYKIIDNQKFKDDLISNISVAQNLETPIYKTKNELLITKFDFQLLKSMIKPVNKKEKKLSQKITLKLNKPKKEDLILSTIKTNKGKINSKINKKFGLNINKNSEQIILNHLKLDDKDFNEMCSINLPFLSKLSLSENNITTLEPLSKIKSKKIEELYLDNNSISNIDSIKSLEISNLKNIILYSNKISSLDAFVGLSFSKLTQLNLYNNKVNNIDVLAKIYMPKLQILHLGFNKIQNIDVLEKVYFPELISLNLNRNEINSINALKKSSFPKLEKLDFFDNNISDIEAISKVNFPELKELNFWINNIQNIKPLCDADFPLLQKLNLSNNNIIDLKNFDKLNFLLLNELNIQYNKINIETEENKKILAQIQKNITIIKY